MKKPKPLLKNWRKELKNILARQNENIVMDLMIEDFIDKLLTEQRWDLSVKFTKKYKDTKL